MAMPRQKYGFQLGTVRKKLKRSEDVDWAALAELGYIVGEMPDDRIAKKAGCAVTVVSREREERGIPKCDRKNKGNWPSNAELRRQNKEAGERREAELSLNGIAPTSVLGWGFDDR
jgi:hypothetical protein